MMTSAPARSVASVAFAVTAAVQLSLGATDDPSRDALVQAQAPVFNAGVDIIDASAIVIDRDRRFVTGLRKEDFVVYDDGRPQPIVAFSSERVAVSLGILIDTSGSMVDSRVASAGAVLDILSSFLGADDEVFLATFARDMRLLQGWTTDRTLLQRAVQRMPGGAGTALYEGVNDALREAFTGTRTRMALLLISDGHDTLSLRSARDVKQALSASGVVMYALAVQDAAPGARKIREGALKDLTDATAGRTEIVRDQKGLDDAVRRLAGELGQHYVLGYPRPPGPAGRWHEIRVEVPKQNVTERARRGYASKG
jgi:VWFA-related protein